MINKTLSTNNGNDGSGINGGWSNFQAKIDYSNIDAKIDLNNNIKVVNDVILSHKMVQKYKKKGSFIWAYILFYCYKYIPYFSYFYIFIKRIKRTIFSILYNNK